MHLKGYSKENLVSCLLFYGEDLQTEDIGELDAPSQLQTSTLLSLVEAMELEALGADSKSNTMH